MGDWIFTTLTWLLLVLGLLGLAWAMLWDRSRGRKRCPKCWYLVDGVPQTDGTTTCPECGKVVCKPRKLRKTRRHWGFAALALIPMAGAYASHAYPSVRDHGWWRIAPDIVLIAMLPRMQDFHGVGPSPSSTVNEFADEVARRFALTTIRDARAYKWDPDRLNAVEKFLTRRTARGLLLDRRTMVEYQGLALHLLVAAHDGHIEPLPQGFEAEAVIRQSWYAYTTTDHTQAGVLILGQQAHSYVLFCTTMQDGRMMRVDEAFAYDGYLSPTPSLVHFLQTPGTFSNHTGEWLRSQMMRTHVPVDKLLANASYGWGTLVYEGVEAVRGRPCHRVTGRMYYKDRTLWIDQETRFLLTEGDVHYLLPDTNPLPDTDWATDPAASPLPAMLDAINALLPRVDLLNTKIEDG